jgi:hypothetical protein
MKVWRAALRASLAAIGLVAMVGTAAAQSSTSGDVQGVVRDPSGKEVAGATVVANGPQGARATTTAADGSYLIEFLTPGNYDVTATAQGFQPVTQRNVQVRLGTRATLNMNLAPLAEAEETVTITAAAPTVDTGTTSTSTSIGSDLIGSIPTSRSFAGLVALAPGVVDAGDLGIGNPSVSGASGLENEYIVNGVNITNTGYGSVGSYSIVYGSLGTGVNFDFIDQVNIKSAGFEAEYGEALGGVIAVTTKRGTNEFHGTVFGNWQPGQLESPRRQLFLQNGSATIGRFYSEDAGVTIGGPIVKDKAFFFAAVNPQSTSQERRAPDNFPLAVLGTEITRRDRTSYAGTLTWNVLANHSLELSAFGDPGVSEFGPQLGSDLLGSNTQQYSTLRFGGHNEILRYNGVIGSFMSAEAVVAHADNTFQQSFPAENDQWQFTDLRSSPPVVSGGVGFYEKQQDSINNQYGLKLTNYVNAAGRHEIKYGALYENVQFNADRNRTGPTGVTFLDENGVQRVMTTGVTYNARFAIDGSTIYRVTRGDYSTPKRDTTTDYTTIFLQDKWSPIPTLTLDIGVRTEEQKLIGSGAGHISYTFKYGDNIAPRLGASWDFTGKGKGKVFAHYGRYVEKIPNDIAVRSLSTEQGVSRVDFFDAALTQQIPDGTDPFNTSAGPSTTHVITQGAEATTIAPGTKSQYQDEVTIGTEYEPMETVNVGLRYIHRQLGRVLEDYQTSTADGIQAGTEDFGNYVVGNPGTGLNSTCPAAFPNCWVAPSRIYDAMELTLEKRLTTNWQVLASYRLSRLYGNYEGLYRNDNGQSDPNITSLFDFPNNTPLMAGQGRKGLLNTDRTHVLKVAGSYMTAVGLNVGVNYNWLSGTPKTRLLAHPVYENSGELPEGKRGDSGRTPSTSTIDVHADYGLPVRKGMDLRASVDIFNILDNQDVVTVDQNVELGPGIPDPDYNKATLYQAPRQIRFGLRLAF